MSDPVNWTGIAIALLLPWACGAAWVTWLMRRCGLCHPGLSVGYGFFVGLLGTTVLLRGWDAITGAVSFGAVASILVALTVAAGIALRAVPATATPKQPLPPHSSAWQKAGVALLLLWLGARYGTMAQEMLLRPLFAWDAWMNWAPKAITWFHQGTLVPWVEPRLWYQEAGGYSLGNWIASGYPEGVPLVQLWFMLGAGTWDHGAVYIAWLAVPLALGAALYSHLRLAQVSALAALTAVYLLLNMPFFNVHTVLAGYADSWLAAVFGLGIFALREWRLTRQGNWLTLWLSMAIMCTLLKNPGIILGLILALAGIREAMKLPTLVELGAVAAVAIVAVVLVYADTTFPLPLLGDIGWQDGRLSLGRIGSFEILYHPVGSAFAESFFLSTNWNLLMYFAPPLILWLGWRNRASALQPPAEVVALLGACAFVLFSFFFTNRFGGALNFSTVNRALLYLAPPLIYCLTIALHQASSHATKERHSAA